MFQRDNEEKRKDGKGIKGFFLGLVLGIILIELIRHLGLLSFIGNIL